MLCTYSVPYTVIPAYKSRHPPPPTAEGSQHTPLPLVPVRLGLGHRISHASLDLAIAQVPASLPRSPHYVRTRPKRGGGSWDHGHLFVSYVEGVWRSCDVDGGGWV